jgi:hypothetical protein
MLDQQVSKQFTEKFSGLESDLKVENPNWAAAG